MNLDNQQLTIRPLPKQGECLTSYLFRITNLNYCGDKDIWRDISVGSIYRLKGYQYHRLDYDFTMIDSKKFTALSGLDQSTINKLTFYNLYTKFFDDPYSDFERAKVMIQPFLNKKQRKFCPQCLKQNPSFKLIWQVMDIEICDIHNVELRNSCIECGHKVSYSMDCLEKQECENSTCNFKLTDRIVPIVDKDYIDTQKERCSRWGFLMNSDVMLTEAYGKLTMERSLALKLLYIAQNQQPKYKRKDIRGISKNIIKTLVAHIRGVTDVKKVNLKLLFQLLDLKGLSIEKFAQINVPESYLNSVFSVKKSFEAQGCLTPWCPKYMKITSMQLVNEGVRPRKSGVKYSRYFVCKECFMRYSHHPNNDIWQEIDRQIDLVNCIREKAFSGYNRRNIVRELKMNHYKVSEIYGYLAYHGLIPEELCAKYMVEVIPSNLKELFEALDIDKNTYPETKYMKAKSLYGWSVIQYSYFYAQCEVQELFLFKTLTLKKPKKKVNSLQSEAKEKIKELIHSEISISFAQIAASVDCSEQTLRSHGLSEIISSAKEEQKSLRMNEEEKNFRRLFDVYIQEERGAIQYRDIYKLFGRYRDYLVKNYPGLINYINRKKSEIYKNLKDKKQQRLVHDVKEAIIIASRKYQSLNPTNVAKELGIQSIHVAGYKKVKECIKTEINRFYEDS